MNITDPNILNSSKCECVCVREKECVCVFIYIYIYIYIYVTKEPQQHKSVCTFKTLLWNTV